MSDRLDVRLAPAALAAYAAACCGVRASPGHALVAAGAVACMTFVVLLVLSFVVPVADPVAPVVVLAGGVAVAVLLATAVQLHVRDDGPWSRLDGRSVRVVAEVTGDPQRLAAAWPGGPPGVAWTADVRRLAPASGGPTAWAVSAPVRVLAHATDPRAGAQPTSTVDAPPFGSTVELTGTLQVEPRGRRSAATIVLTARWTVLHAPPAPVAVTSPVRASVASQAARMRGDAAGLLPGVTVGDTSGVSDDLAAAMRTAGLTHLVAVSGAHFALVGALVLSGLGAVRAPRWLRAPGAVAAGLTMLLLVHPSASVVRAAVMGLVGALGIVLGRPGRATAALATACVVLLVLDPWLATEIGFALSVLATGGLVVLGGPLAVRWSSRCGRPVATALAVPVAAQLACAPVVVLLTPSVSTWSVVANLAAAPAVAPATLCGLGAGVVGTVWPAAGQLLAWPAGAACWWIGAVARAAAGAPGAQVAWLPGPVGAVVLALACVCAAVLLLRRRRGAGT
ncbi:ComEC/Rec2 family competence protein [Cellulomonas sp. HZM]|uniref:ComEC/Rec2 family competence protein n=1 Tax=Cellulomonas sp. HZM TaxID=1454010 RepID=UPI00068EE0B8|nr:ComEC/Rec2 family competence protein [Cellulomonas sp. HZM]